MYSRSFFICNFYDAGLVLEGEFVILQIFSFIKVNKLTLEKYKVPPITRLKANNF